MREGGNGAVEMLSTLCRQRYVPKDLPPKSLCTTTWLAGAVTTH